MNSKHYQKDFQSVARKWWNTLSINEMKAFESKHKIISSMASASEIAAIYEFETK